MQMEHFVFIRQIKLGVVQLWSGQSSVWYYHLVIRPCCFRFQYISSTVGLKPRYRVEFVFPFVVLSSSFTLGPL